MYYLLFLYWQSYVDRSAVLEEYKLYKNVFSVEAYLLCVPKNLRMYLTRFRISSHSLRIQTDIYEKNKIARNEIYCIYCGSRDIKDTYHFIFFALAIQHFVLDVLINCTFYDHLSLHLTC